MNDRTTLKEEVYKGYVIRIIQTARGFRIGNVALPPSHPMFNHSCSEFRSVQAGCGGINSVFTVQEAPCVVFPTGGKVCWVTFSLPPYAELDALLDECRGAVDQLYQKESG